MQDRVLARFDYFGLMHVYLKLPVSTIGYGALVTDTSKPLEQVMIGPWHQFMCEFASYGPAVKFVMLPQFGVQETGKYGPDLMQ